MEGSHAHEVIKRIDDTPVVSQASMLPGSIYDRILEKAIEEGAPLEQLEKFLDLKYRDEAKEAEQSFYQAVADFSSESVHVTKDKVNSQFKSKYTSLGNLLSTVSPVLGKYGLSVSFDINQADKAVTVSCILRHRLGHTERVEMSAPPDTSGGNSKNPIQQIKSTITYLRSATFEAVTGLASTDATLDDDGNAAGQPVEYVTGDELEELKALAAEVVEDPEAFFKLVGATSIESIPVQNYHKAISLLRQKMAKMRQPGEGE